MVREFDQFVSEKIHKKLLTPLIWSAEKNNKKFVTGDKMLLHQAANQFYLWTNKKMPFKIIEDAFISALS
jgi:shikimate 5-dehydrogenase